MMNLFLDGFILCLFLVKFKAVFQSNPIKFNLIKNNYTVIISFMILRDFQMMNLFLGDIFFFVSCEIQRCCSKQVYQI